MHSANDNRKEPALKLAHFKHPLAVSLVALMTASAMTAPAYADLTNTFSVEGDSPTGTDDVTATVDESVDLQDATPQLALTKSGVITTDADSDGQLDAGDVITYTYTLTNPGTVSIDNATLSDAHDGVNALTFGTVTLTNTSGNSSDADDSDLIVDRLDPGDQAVFTSTYTVTPADVAAAGADGDLDNTAVVNGEYDDDNNSGTANTPVASNNATEALPYDADASLAVTKVASADTDVPVGTLITYTYTITNDGNVPVSNITMNDAHPGSGTLSAFTFVGIDDSSAVGTSTNTGGDDVIEVLAPGAVATYTATYTITQDDVDTFQP